MKVKRETLADQVTQGLVAWIDQQNLAPGDALPSEAQLAEDFGVSRPVIREALKTLQGEGIIEVITGKNAVIKPLSSALLRKFFARAVAFQTATFQDLIEVRRGLEIQSVRLAAERCTAEDLAALEATFARMRAEIHQHQRFAEQDVQFHLQIASAARNPILYYLVESIRDVMRANVIHGLRHRFSEEDYAQVQARHAAILVALRAQDADQAQWAMQAHFDEALKALLFPNTTTEEDTHAD
ncbi:MAG: FadR family transcriptional regulator [Anaerolineae bacterium]|nr:FadR family transcriptional regulator [Anaerolineae bacterium]